MAQTIIAIENGPDGQWEPVELKVAQTVTIRGVTGYVCRSKIGLWAGDWCVYIHGVRVTDGGGTKRIAIERAEQRIARASDQQWIEVVARAKVLHHNTTQFSQ